MATTTIRGRRTFRLAVPPVSGVVRARPIAVCLLLALAVFAVFCLGLSIGEFRLSLEKVLLGLWGSTDRGTLFIVRGLRLPRELVALMAGAAFGLSGAMLQTLTRNPLAGPDMIGISSGATTAVVTGIVLGFGSGLGTQALGLLGGLLTAFVIYLLAWRRGTSGYRIVLVGIGVSWMCISLTDYLLAKAFPWQAHQAVGWMVGNLNNRTYDHVRPLMIALAVLVPAALLIQRWSNTLQLGDKVATALGIPLRLAQPALLVTAVALVSFATASSGPILFVALAAPQIARLLSGTPVPPPIASALTGSLMVLSADLIARFALPESSLPVGVVTGVLGAPVLLWLLARANRTGSGG